MTGSPFQDEIWMQLEQKEMVVQPELYIEGQQFLNCFLLLFQVKNHTSANCAKKHSRISPT